MKVILDAGHGINTPGKGSPYALNGVAPELYIKEYQYCRKLVNAIAAGLRNNGIDVEVLVKDDFDMPLIQRVSKANQIYAKDKESFLVSVHLNAAGDGSKWIKASYWAVYTSVGKTRSDIIADYLWLSARKNFIGKKLKSDTFDGDYDVENNFYILKNTACPAILTENFFQDSIDDVKYLLSDTGFNAIVKCHVDGILEYIKNYNNDKGRTR